MVLHLLGKKSWNVYNTDNTARVRRDEAEAKTREEEEQRRLQKADAEKRIQILRGQRSPSNSPPPSLEAKPKASQRREAEQEPRHRKRRRIAGENDTDRDIRFAREDAQLAEATREEDVVLFRKEAKDAPLIDESGHINLFPPSAVANDPSGNSGKNPEAEMEAARKKREYEDQYTMRFSNAAGFRQSLDKNPWYSSSNVDIAAQTAEDMLPNKDVWGNEDPRRQERERERITSNDPLAAMKKGIHQLKAVEKERKKWEEERREKLRDLKKEEERKQRRYSSRHRKERRRRRRRGSDASRDSLEGFSLDADVPLAENARERESSKKRNSHRDRRERSRDRSPRHSRSHDDRHSHRSSRNHDKERGKRSSGDDQSSGWVPAPGKRYSAQFANV
ncbi:uncharacterized protein PADG_00897 [Paracoccidioides brasiliensis Pb18]|uniref:CBF1-interacting co-repressor CIR N-terminal domain-containing protein n=1 Tax=Paracoccidioides brasiliensis (strain Pb18) TaxID=502780 RepID=C1FYM1_PARBD|nr:uncharacterized protein PADG_00897 [Paracoccidioides brasiliensis Pb18]EEH44608.2 hypothetical protein PADG_00897 [Paracoccidioides brasiliensis Pb18]